MKRAPFLFAGVLGVLLTLAIACGGAAAPTATKAPAAKATPAPAAKPAATPASAPQPAVAATHEIASVGEEFKFDQSKLSAKAGTVVALIFKNTAKTPGLQHNWVLVKAGTKDQVATAGTAAGPTNNWVPQKDDRVIAYTKQIDPGKTGEVQFTAPAAGTYQFVCTFPGHNITMFGEFTATP